jgi:NADPH:quinone reductase-like Zn-dependent oxidoreductase
MLYDSRIKVRHRERRQDMATSITYDRYGTPEVLTPTEFVPTEPSATEVQIEVRAAGVNAVDAKLRRGELAHIFEASFPVTPGIEVAGVVIAVGDQVNHVAVGDEVFGVASSGGYAEIALASHVEIKPKELSWELAAALPTVGEAAFRTLGHLGLRTGERLLIHGAAGSAGTLAVQLAVGRGIEVIGTASSEDLDSVRSRGAVAVEYGDGLVERVRDIYHTGVDAVLDTSGAGVLPESIELAGGPERVITIADERAFQLGVRFTGPDPTDRDREALAKLATLSTERRIELPIGKTYRLLDAAKAHADLEGRDVKGKSVLFT